MNEYINLNSSVCCVITAISESPVNFDMSLPSYGDVDNDEVDFAAVGLPLKSCTVNMECIREHQAAHGEGDAVCSSVCAPILVVPSSDSFISLIRTPDSSPNRPRMISPSQARHFLFSVMF